MRKDNHFSPIIFALILIGGILLGQLLSPSNNTNALENNKFNLILQQLDELYVDSLAKEELVEKAVENLLTELDPHSSYIPAKDLEAVNEPMEGSFDGIGVEFNLKDDTILVVAPISGGPSQKVGIQAGDKIISVDGEVIAGTNLTNQKVFDLLRGERGTKVTLEILRIGEKELIVFDITRGKIPIHSVDVAYMVDHELGYIKVNRFSATTFEEFKVASEQLLNKGMQKLLLDLRNNPGGYLGAAINMANEFLVNNKLIVYTEGRSRKKEEYFSNASGQLLSTKVVVLIDEGSASASEIVAGALQDNDRGTVAGRRSFGKGLVQEQFEHNDGSAFRITTQRYFTPTGRCIQKPYEKGDKDGYDNDWMIRLESGELTSKDSIDFADSLMFVTPKGKIVYGGGGIMPDVFIPLDTNSYHNSITKANRKDLVRSFAFDYTNQHRKELELLTLEAFIQFFEIDIQSLKALARQCEEAGVDLKMYEWTLEDKKIISTQLKAFIARNIWNDAGFYPVIHQIDETFQEAIRL
ncbi:MAG: peptidase S41 [Flavobacteriales bacterium]|mgnify:CR=1 FL=1|nr:peptidase S41 [Flavobacteriales bacterium]|tara:strand:+ start:30240 stop:31814 length:1575 start_codon:yes stop_codon:yes gene_type:complete